MNRNYIFYISTTLLGILLLFLLRPHSRDEISFYGFAESQETEINYNYPVVVDRILVKPGQAVNKGDTLVHLSRRKKSEELLDQEYKISVLKAEQNLWMAKKQNELSELEFAHGGRMARLNAEINQLNERLQYKNDVLKKLKTVTIDSASYIPMKNELDRLLTEKTNMIAQYKGTKNSINREMLKGKRPFDNEISLLEADREFEESQKNLKIVVLAPENGLIGTISCKEEEHVPSFKTLLTFYEPHSHLVKGYVHEDFILQVSIGDKFSVSSLKDSEITYEGTVIGLGSRIVEIPSRLRKIPDYKTYGREVLVEIDPNNQFLQKEKVGLFFAESNGN